MLEAAHLVVTEHLNFLSFISIFVEISKFVEILKECSMEIFETYFALRDIDLYLNGYAALPLVGSLLELLEACDRQVKYQCSIMLSF